MRRRRTGLFIRTALSLIWLGTLATAAVSAEEPTSSPSSDPQASAPQSSLWNPTTWHWVPTAEEILKYRRSWNPMTHGPILNTGVDIQPKGQFLVQPFVFMEFGHQQFPNRLTTSSDDSPFHLQAIAPTVIFAYGITDHFELNVAPSVVWFQSSRANGTGSRDLQTETGIGDTTIY